MNKSGVFPCGRSPLAFQQKGLYLLMKNQKLWLAIHAEKVLVVLLSISVLLAGCAFGLGISRNSRDPAAPKYIEENTVLSVITKKAEAMGIILSPSTETISLTLTGKPEETALLTIDLADERSGLKFAYVNYKEKDAIFYEPIDDLNEIQLIESFKCNVGYYKIGNTDISLCIVDAIEEKNYSEKKLQKSLGEFLDWFNRQAAPTETP